MLDCISLVWYRTGSGIISFLHSGTGLTWCRTFGHFENLQDWKIPLPGKSKPVRRSLQRGRITRFTSKLISKYSQKIATCNTVHGHYGHERNGHEHSGHERHGHEHHEHEQRREISGRRPFKTIRVFFTCFLMLQIECRNTDKKFSPASLLYR